MAGLAKKDSSGKWSSPSTRQKDVGTVQSQGCALGALAFACAGAGEQRLKNHPTKPTCWWIMLAGCLLFYGQVVQPSRVLFLLTSSIYSCFIIGLVL